MQHSHRIDATRVMIGLLSGVAMIGVELMEEPT